MSGSRFSKRLRNLSPSPQSDLDELNHERRKQIHIQKTIQDSQSEKIVQQQQQQPESVERSSHNVTVRVQERNEEEQDLLKTVVSPPKLMYKKAAKFYTEQQHQQPSIQAILGYSQQAESSTMAQARNISGRSNQKEEQLVKKKNLEIQQKSDEFKEIEDSADDLKIDKSQSKGKYVPKKNTIKASKSLTTALQEVVKMIPDKRKQKNPSYSSNVVVSSNNSLLLNGIQELRSTVVAQREKLEDLFKELKKFKSSLTQEDGSIRDLKDEPTKQRLQELIDQYNEYTNNNLVQEELLNPTIELLKVMIDQLSYCIQ
ncbi:hypothetical protein INT45_007611 [Circinella minor]|uniref:Uncharacterized protein n=1 Tax=Circinella minor TaxID=1195481 RepID=A0A8H7VLC3_9FUNG|nr:hypothetical protein INT45_007611 [Circinella minor]